ncbi:MAG TPA: AAA family ATPase [Spirochaetota bacterium]|nr:AAA family ATPase [Spirochaetota bacterium]
MNDRPVEDCENGHAAVTASFKEESMAKPSLDPNKDWEELLKSEFTEGVKPNAETAGSKPGTGTHQSDINFDIKPEELESYLNRYVVGQEQAVEVIATKVCTHFNRMKLDRSIPEEERIVGNIKSNMLLIGPTGVGKTYIIKLIAKRIGVPFVKADATKFSETGYVGGDVEDLVRELVHEADGDIGLAEYGIIYLDEIDKIASTGNVYGPDVSRSGVQRNLLKLMEESEVDLKTPHDLASQVEAAMEAQRTGKVTRKKINTRNILFIVSGAFGAIADIVKKRLNMQSIGFEQAASQREERGNLLKEIKTEDLIQFGFESEFVGRLPVTVVLNEMTEEGLYNILKNRYSTVVLGKKLDFRAYDIDLEFTDEALRVFARKAYAERTGARGLLSVFERALIKFEKTLPCTEIKKLMIDIDAVERPEETLKKMLLSDSIKHFQKDFLLKNGIYLDFRKDAAERVQEMAQAANRSIKQLCGELFHDYAYGIRLMSMEHFTITREAVENPQAYLDNYIRENYKKN